MSEYKTISAMADTDNYHQLSRKRQIQAIRRHLRAVGITVGFLTWF